MMTRNAVKTLWVKFILLGFICHSTAYSQSSAEELKRQTETKLAAVTRTAVEAYFSRIDTLRPETIQVEVDAPVDTLIDTNGATIAFVKEINIQLAMASDLNSAQTKDMRLSILRALTGQGFATEIAPDASLPKASLRVNVTPGPVAKKTYNWRDISIVTSLGGVAIVLLCLAVYLVTIPLRRQSKPLPFSEEGLNERDFTLDADKFSLLAYESPEIVRAVFTAIPIEQVMRLLGQTDKKAQRKIIKKLNLKSSVRSKLERELAVARNG